MANKFTQARANLILDEPFFGALALRLNAVEDPTTKTFWTDGKSIGYNPAYAEKLSLAEMQGVICHEVMHVACGHPWRRDNRDKRTWNEAADYAINPIIVDAKMKLPGGPLIDPIYRGQSVEQIYAARAAQKATEDKQRAEEEEKKRQEEKKEKEAKAEQEKTSPDEKKPDEEKQGKEEERGQEDGEGEEDLGIRGDDSESSQEQSDQDEKGQGEEESEDMGCGEVRDSTGEDAEVEETEWKVAVLQAAQAAKAQGKLPAGVEQLVEKIRKTRVDWKAALRRFVQMCASQDYSWRMPDKKFVGAGLYMPALISESMPPVVIYWDTSGSMNALQAECAAEAAAVIEECRPEKTYVVYGDAKVQRVDEFEAGEPVEFHPKGGGGTRFEPIFEWVKEQGIEPACFIGITDLMGSFPKEVPDYPVIWVQPNGRLNAPFGEIIRLEDA